MALSGPQGPQLVYTHPSGSPASAATPRATTEEIEAETLAKALELAHRLEELLEDTRSVASVAPSSAERPEDPRTHSTRMARAMAASLVDELEALVRPSRRTGSS